MTTPFDWITMAVFAALVVLYLQRSVGPAVRGDRAILYLPPALGCAVANFLGNAGHRWIAGLLIFASIAFIVTVLRPFGTRSGPF